MLRAGRTSAVLLLIPFGIAALAAALLLPRLEFHHDSRSLLRADPKAEREELELIEDFGSEDILLVAWETGDLTDPEEFRTLRSVTEALAEVPGLEEVYSLASPAVRLPLGPAGLLRPLRESDLTSEASRDRVRELLRAAPVYLGTIYNRELDVAAVAGTLAQAPRAQREATLRRVREVAATFENSIRVLHVAGVTALAVDAGEYAVSDLRRIGGLALTVSLAVLLVLCRSWRETVAALIATGLPPLYALGIACAAGIPMTALGAALFPVLAVVGVTSSVHLLAALGEQLRSGASAATAPWRAVRSVAAPITMSLLTTGAAFASLGATGVPAFHRGGYLVAVGLLCAIPVLLVCLPAALVLVRPAQRRGTARRWRRPLLRLVECAMRRRVLLTAIGLVTCVVGAVLLSRAPLQVEVLQAFRPESRIARTYRFLDQRLTATVPLDVVLTVRGDATDTAVLDDLERFAERVLREPGVESAISAATLARYGRSVLPIDVGDSAALAYLRVNLPEILRRFEEGDGQRYRIKIRMREGTAPEVLDHVATAAADMRTGEAHWTGLFVRAVDTTRRLRGDLLRGTLLMALLVTVLLAVSTRSWRLGAAALLPNLFAPACLFGSAVLLGAALDVSSVAVGAVAVGLAVDDTFHLAFRIAAERRRGRSLPSALRHAQCSVGRALILSSVVLAAGLGCLWLSAFTPTARFGLLSACAALFALLANLTLLPAGARILRS